MPESYCIADKITPTNVAFLYLGSEIVSLRVIVFSPPSATLIASILFLT
jgi:hypothetical protein